MKFEFNCPRVSEEMFENVDGWTPVPLVSLTAQVSLKYVVTVELDPL